MAFRKRCAAAALIFAGGALSAQADALDDLAPCLSVQASQDAYVKDFLALGWSEAQGADRERAIHASGEIQLALPFMRQSFRDRDDVVNFVAQAQKRGQRHAEMSPGVYLVNGDRNLLVETVTVGELTTLLCLMTARDLDSVRAVVPAGPLEFGESVLAFNMEDVPITPEAGMIAPRLILVRMIFPFPTKGLAAGGDALYLTVGLNQEEEATQ